MLSKAEAMQCSRSTLITGNVVECKNSPIWVEPESISLSALLTTHLEQLNFIFRALIEKISGSTGANFTDQQSLIEC